jgi:predicted XRE-type DNA-binding protein
MGEIVRFRPHALARAGSISRSKLDAETSPPVAFSIATATRRDGPRLPARISDRYDLETPTARAKSDCGPSLSRTNLARRAKPSMPDSLPQVNRKGQGQVYCGKIDFLPAIADDPGMERERSIKEPKLYIGEWIEALGLTQKEVAKASGVKKSYLNLLCKRKRDNPSLNVLQSIAEAMGLTIQNLQTRPPEAASIETIRKIPSDLIERLRRQRRAG